MSKLHRDHQNRRMLTAIKKALILRQVGIDVPRFPGISASASLRHFVQEGSASPEQCDSEALHAKAVERWNQQIEVLFVIYTAARTAKCLREAEQARQMDMLRRANSRI
jgi:hypothetical protein